MKALFSVGTSELRCGDAEKGPQRTKRPSGSESGEESGKTAKKSSDAKIAKTNTNYRIAADQFGCERGTSQKLDWKGRRPVWRGR